MTTMPADFLVDESGVIRRTHYGQDEGITCLSTSLNVLQIVPEQDKARGVSAFYGCAII